MIRHVVMFRWTPEAAEEQKQRVAAERKIAEETTLDLMDLPEGAF